MLRDGEYVAFGRPRPALTRASSWEPSPADGIEMEGTVIHRPEDGKVAEARGQFDRLGLLERRGAVELPR